MKSITSAELIDKITHFSNGRKEISYYLISAADKESAVKWIKENVYYEPHVMKVLEGKNYFLLEVEEWVD